MEWEHSLTFSSQCFFFGMQSLFWVFEFETSGREDAALAQNALLKTADQKVSKIDTVKMKTSLLMEGAILA